MRPPSGEKDRGDQEKEGRPIDEEDVIQLAFQYVCHHPLRFMEIDPMNRRTLTASAWGVTYRPLLGLDLVDPSHPWEEPRLPLILSSPCLDSSTSAKQARKKGSISSYEVNMMRNR
jgi:hypothetical protein